MSKPLTPSSSLPALTLSPSALGTLALGPLALGPRPSALILALALRSSTAYFFLHARKLQLRHPISRELLEFEAPLPEAWETCLAEMRREVR